MGSVPKLKELSANYADQGLVLIGIHSKKGAANMPAFVAKKGIGYPVAVDRDGKTVQAFGVDGYPDYHIIDRSGNLRVADLSNGDLEAAIKALLAEPVPSSGAPSIPAPMQAAANLAKRKRTRILSIFGSKAELTAFTKLTRLDRDLGTLLRNEYQVAPLDVAEYGDLMKNYSADGQALLVAQEASGAVLGARPLAGLNGSRLTEFLQTYRLPQQDAEALWERAKSQAEREQKRVLVHLGAPW